MVRIVNYLKRQTEEGKEFFVLEVQGGIEMVLSQSTQKYYATAKKAYVSSTFDEATCKALIGTEMPGTVSKVECDPYEFVSTQTGEIVTLSHNYVYTPIECTASKEDLAIKKLMGEELSLAGSEF